MKYKLKTLTPNAAGIYQAPKGWRIHTVLFSPVPDIAAEMRVLLEQTNDQTGDAAE